MKDTPQSALFLFLITVVFCPERIVVGFKPRGISFLHTQLPNSSDHDGGKDWNTGQLDTTTGKMVKWCIQKVHPLIRGGGWQDES